MKTLKKLITWIVLLIIVGAIAGSTMFVAGCVPGSGDQKEKEPEVDVETIIATLQPLSELATLRVGVSGIVNASQDGRHWWQGSSRMVMLVRGAALYSVDLSKVGVEIEADQVTINLPQPRILNAWVDVDRTVIWEKERGRFREHHPVKLEEQAWHAAKQMVWDAASASQYRDDAARHAEALIRTLVAPLGLDALVAWHDG